eukprot:PhF_6_TR36041/c0_g1_i2/m.52258
MQIPASSQANENIRICYQYDGNTRILSIPSSVTFTGLSEELSKRCKQDENSETATLSIAYYLHDRKITVLDDSDLMECLSSQEAQRSRIEERPLVELLVEYKTQKKATTPVKQPDPPIKNYLELFPLSSSSDSNNSFPPTFQWKREESHMGAGGTAKVYRAFRSDYGDIIVVKQIVVVPGVRNLEKEVNVMKDLHHENIVGYLG